MSIWELPKKLEVGGEYWDIRWDYRPCLDCMLALGDRELDNVDKGDVVCRILYIDWKTIYERGLFVEAIKAAYKFLSCEKQEITGQRTPPSLVNWRYDAPMIFAAINSKRERDVREVKEMHWWTFMGLYSEIHEGTFATVCGIRYKKSRGIKLEKHERKYMSEHPEYFVDHGTIDAYLQEYIDLLGGGEDGEKQLEHKAVQSD